MAEVISFQDVARKRTVTEQDAWQRYVSARNRAETTGDIRDGIAAGQAWAAWLRLFERGEH